MLPKRFETCTDKTAKSVSAKDFQQHRCLVTQAKVSEDTYLSGGRELRVNAKSLALNSESKGCIKLNINCGHQESDIVSLSVWISFAL